MSPPDWRAAALHFIRGQLTTWSKVSPDGQVQIKNERLGKLGPRWEPQRKCCLASPLKIDSADWFRRAVTGGKFITGGFTVGRGGCDFICNEGSSSRRQRRSAWDRSAVARSAFSHSLHVCLGEKGKKTAGQFLPMHNPTPPPGAYLWE